MSLCTASVEESREFRRFGRTLINSCNFDLAKLITTSSIKPSNINIFYEIFLVDSNGDLIDVPIAIHNYKDAAGNNPNKGIDYAGKKFVRRFFMYDTVSGIEGSGEYNKGKKTSTVVRYAESITFRF